MINEKEFIQLIEYYQEINNICDSLYDCGVDIINSPLFENYSRILSITLKLSFNAEGIEFIDNFLEESCLVLEIDGEEKEYKDASALWELIKDYRI